MKHGMKHTRLYRIWGNIKSRCNNPNTTHYNSYGGRGISICKEWDNDFSAFMEWSISNGYNDSLTIDRIDQNGDYCPENCRWTSQKVQCNNFSRNKMITYLGKTQSLTMWCEELNLSYSMVKRRLAKGKSVEEAFEKPKYQPKTLSFNDCTMTVKEWSIKTGIPERIIYERLRHNWPIERILNTPKLHD
jgi:hypothetical protein